MSRTVVAKILRVTDGYNLLRGEIYVGTLLKRSGVLRVRLHHTFSYADPGTFVVVGTHPGPRSICRSCQRLRYIIATRCTCGSRAYAAEDPRAESLYRD